MSSRGLQHALRALDRPVWSVRDRMASAVSAAEPVSQAQALRLLKACAIAPPSNESGPEMLALRTAVGQMIRVLAHLQTVNTRGYEPLVNLSRPVVVFDAGGGEEFEEEQNEAFDALALCRTRPISPTYPQHFVVAGNTLHKKGTLD